MAMKMDWSAEVYSRFLDDRTRPARDLLAAVPQVRAQHVVDLGSGPGNSTALLADRFPTARVLGVDSDPDMVRTARKALPDHCFEQAMIENWQPEIAPDLIFANASLQWIGHHKALFPRLISLLAPAGTLAVQMPDNLDEPSHAGIRELARSEPWRDRLAAITGHRRPLLTPAQLHALLRPLCIRLDIWRTTYHPELASVDAIVEWFTGSALRPYLAVLDADERQRFLSAYRDRIAPFYPETAGRVLLPFPRFFFVAQVAG